MEARNSQKNRSFELERGLKWNLRRKKFCHHKFLKLEFV